MTIYSASAGLEVPAYWLAFFPANGEPPGLRFFFDLGPAIMEAVLPPADEVFIGGYATGSGSDVLMTEPCPAAAVGDRMRGHFYCGCVTPSDLSNQGLSKAELLEATNVFASPGPDRVLPSRPLLSFNATRAGNPTDILVIPGRNERLRLDAVRTRLQVRFGVEVMAVGLEKLKGRVAARAKGLEFSE